MKKLITFVSLLSTTSVFAIPMSVINHPAVLKDVPTINEYSIKAAILNLAIIAVGTGVFFGAKKILK